MALQIYNEHVYLISTTGLIKVFDSNYKMVKEISLSDNALTRYHEKQPYIYKTFLEGSKVHVIYRFLYDKSVIQFPGAVHVYDIETGKLQQKTELRLPDEKKWWAEDMEVLPITKD